VLEDGLVAGKLPALVPSHRLGGHLFSKHLGPCYRDSGREESSKYHSKRSRCQVLQAAGGLTSMSAVCRARLCGSVSAAARSVSSWSEFPEFMRVDVNSVRWADAKTPGCAGLWTRSVSVCNSKFFRDLQRARANSPGPQAMKSAFGKHWHAAILTKDRGCGAIDCAGGLGHEGCNIHDSGRL
jgi:hypothetical protein